MILRSTIANLVTIASKEKTHENSCDYIIDILIHKANSDSCCGEPVPLVESFIYTEFQLFARV